ncbi:PspA-associated protein PspAB, partial [Streptomyces alkaliterrae]
VCFASAEGGAFDRVREEARGLLGEAEFTQDSYGYSWVVCRQSEQGVAGLVNDLHAVNTSLQDGGFGPQLLCSLIDFRDSEGRPLAIVYLYKRGTFYPFAPIPGQREKRDNALELQMRALLADDLPVEEDLGRWFPLWDAPGL